MISYNEMARYRALMTEFDLRIKELELGSRTPENRRDLIKVKLVKKQTRKEFEKILKEQNK